MRIARLLLLCALLTACGSSSSHRLSKSEYARRADAICARYQRLASSLAVPSNTIQLAIAARGTLRLLDTAISKLRRLRPPQDEQELAKRWLASLATLRRDVVKLRNRAEANDLAGIHALVGPAQRHDRASLSLAKKLGMNVCSRETG